MNLKLKAMIVEKFANQSNFAFSVREHESMISKVIRGRRELTDQQKQKWAQVLGIQDDDEVFRTKCPD